MRRLKLGMQREFAREGAEAGAEVLLGGIQRRAPVDTGNLRDSYEVEMVSQSRKGATFRVVTDVDYASHQEYGTVHQSGTPHVRPALKEDQRKVKIAMEDTLALHISFTL